MAQGTVHDAFAAAFEAATAKLAGDREGTQGPVSLLATLARYVLPDLNNPVHIALFGLVAFFAVRSVASAVGRGRAERFAMAGVQRRRVVAKRDFTPHELAENDGHDEETPLYIGIKGTVYDVSSSRAFYGPGGPYANFAGRDASRGLALASFEKDILTELDDPIDDLADLTKADQAALDEWAEFFAGKYTAVGSLVGPTAPWKDKTKEAAEEPSEEPSEELSEKPADAAEDKKNQ
ncbi:Dihydrodipicolinate synthase [Coemansia nantahalensis]|uniref:Dihydrodipicolinate synthase n=1 Tax=Coemansia nantahalensis TaxID=2789366 RepID=A0ACC1K581_9FUNG|nr:Dihydrodipicolinate synthase [Coemansia nantahalensis]